MGRQDNVGAFIRDKCGLKLAGAGGNIVCVTADGQFIGQRKGANGYQSNPQLAIDEWEKLPEARRKPGAVRIEEQGPDDPKIVEHVPPPRGVILKHYYRMLAVDRDKHLRHVVLNDFDHADLLSKYRDPEARRHYFEAAPDFLWLTQDEWKSLISSNPRAGDSQPVDPIITQRIVRFHLVPDITFGESNGWRKEQVRAAELTATVEKATTDLVRVRLDGFARLGLDYAAADAAAKQDKHSSHGFEPRLLGYINYDVKQDRISRFDLVAVGDFFGTLYGDNRRLYRAGRTQLGVAFELVTDESPLADHQVAPRAMRLGEKRYYEVQ